MSDYIETLLAILPYRPSLEEALAEVGVSRQAIHHRKDKDPQLAYRYKIAMSKMVDNRRRVASQRKLQIINQKKLDRKRSIAAETDRLEWAMNECNGNVECACLLIGISVPTFYRRLNSNHEFLRRFNAFRVRNGIATFPQNRGRGGKTDGDR